jgi:hypothetical protein
MGLVHAMRSNGPLHQVEDISPTLGHAVLKKVLLNSRVDSDGDVDIDQLNAELTGYEDVGDGGNPGEGDKEDGEPFSIGWKGPCAGDTGTNSWSTFGKQYLALWF